MFTFNKIPRLNIQYSKLLDPIFIFYCKNNPDLKEFGWNDWTPPTQEVISERVKKYKEVWNKYEKLVLTSICKKTSLKFNREVIDVYIVSGNSRQLSFPIVIKSGFSQEEFLEVLSHELIHRLFNINSKIVYKDIFKEMFPNESQTTQEHVITFALLKYLYNEVLKNDAYLSKSIQNTKNTEYKRAWNIVETEGYKKLLKDFVLKIKKRRRL